MGSRTLSGPIRLQGLGLHSGLPCQVELRPGRSGVCFTSLSEPGAPPIRAHVDSVTDTQLATTLCVSGRTIQTVEHLLSAVVGLQLDHLEVAVDGPELPLLDGTAGPWAAAIRSAGLLQLAQPRTLLVVDKIVRVQAGSSWMEARPSAGLQLQVDIDFDHPLIGTQHLDWILSEGSFEAELAWARTFGFEADVARLQEMGLIAGGSLDNAVVFSEHGVLNPGGLRQADEPVRHKAMDMLGDLALIGQPVQGCFVAHRPGHSLVIELVRALLADQDAWHHETAPRP